MNEDRSLPYRCVIRPEECQALLKFGRKSFDCQILDLSREDFHVRVAQDKLHKIKKAKRIELLYRGERWHVCPMNTAAAGADSLYLQRVQELTRTKMPSPWTSLMSLNMSKQTDPRFLLAMLLAFIFACLALPGLGDKVGTAPRIKKGIHSLISSCK